MIVKVKRFNTKRELLKTDVHYPVKVRIQPAGLIELTFDDKDPHYIRFFSSDPVDITIEDFVEDVH